MILIDLVAEERGKLVRLLRRSLSARLGVRDRAEARAVGERGKDFVLVRWAEGVWGVSGPKRRDVLRPGPMEIRAVLVAARTTLLFREMPTRALASKIRPQSPVLQISKANATEMRCLRSSEPQQPAFVSRLWPLWHATLLQ